MARRRAGLSLTGLIIIAGVLYFTGAAGWLWSRIRQLDDSCYALLQKIGTSMGEPACAGLARGLERVDATLDGWSARMQGDGGVQGDGLGTFADNLLDRVSGENGSLARWGSGGDRLRELMQRRPELLPSGSAAKERLRLALDQFVVGQRYLQNAQPKEAMAWLKTSAAQPGGYGVLSQLSLGDAYRTGNYGVEADSGMARRYYQQALDSLAQLQQSGTQESKQLLSSLPDAPDRLRQQIEQRMR